MTHALAGTFRVLTVASLQWLQMKALIPAPADYEVRSVIKFLNCTEHSADRNSSSTVPGLWPHTARRSTHHLLDFRWEVFNHPPYSPDLAPSDFHVSLHLKKFLSGYRQRFQNDREAEMRITVDPIPGGRLLRHRIQKLVPRCDKCLISGSEYVEK